MKASKSRHIVILIGVSLVALGYFLVAHAGYDEPRLIILGDSLSTTHESWPNYLRQLAPRWNIQVMAQNGRTIRDFSIPRDLLTPGNRNETVIYILGCNDILQNNDIMHATYRLKNHLSFLLDRNFKVLLIIPPHLGVDQNKYGQSTEEHRALFESFRGSRENLWVYDLDNVWDNSLTYDGVHPKPALAYEIALVMNMVLATHIF